MERLGFLDYAIIVAYMLFALGTGIYFSKRASQSSENYFLGGQVPSVVDDCRLDGLF